ncbi:MAG: hypothetical protein [Caudoviricetes sp.]|nr:MAG: hypothetical protein [Caudoviricetes sp.]
MADYSVTRGVAPRGFGSSLKGVSGAYYNTLQNARTNRDAQVRSDELAQTSPYRTAANVSRYNADIYANNTDAIQRGVEMGVVQQEATTGNYNDSLRTLISQYGVQGAIDVLVSQGYNIDVASRDVYAVAYGSSLSVPTTNAQPTYTQEAQLNTAPILSGATKNYSY